LQFKEKSAERIKSLETEREQLSLSLTSTKTLLEEKVCLQSFIRVYNKLGKLGKIVAEALFLDMFPWVAKLGNMRFRSKICVCEEKCFGLGSETLPCF